MALTEKQESYCQHYVICGNQAAAYRLAFDADAMNVNSVYVEASKLHSDPKIALRISELRKEAWDANRISLDELIQSLAGMVRFDIADLYNDDGALLPLRQMPLAARQMISQLDVDEIIMDKAVVGHTRKVRTINKLDAIEKLMKHLGGYEKDNAQKPNATVIVNLGNGKNPDE